MKLSTRVRYGLRAMIELAKQDGNNPIPLRELALKQRISSKYLEQMAASLKISGLIESVRGAEGGYRLARPADSITAWDVYNCLDVSVDTIECLQNECSNEPTCGAHLLWVELSDNISRVLKAHNLEKLAKSEQDLTKKYQKSNKCTK